MIVSLYILMAIITILFIILSFLIKDEKALLFGWLAVLLCFILSITSVSIEGLNCEYVTNQTTNLNLMGNVSYENTYLNTVWLNDTENIYINQSYPQMLNTSINCSQIIGSPDADFCTDAGGAGSDTWWPINPPYLFNNSGNLDINGTYLNTTIDARDSDTTYSCSDWAGCSDDSLWDADKLDGQDGSYYLDNTDTWWSIENIYIFNASNVLSFNETRLNATIDARDDTSETTSLPCGNITGATSDLCTIEDTDTHTTLLPIANITNLIDSEVCGGTDKATNITITDLGLSIVCSADIDTDTHTTSLPASNITGLSYTTSLPIGNITNLISSYACSGTDKLTNVTINGSGIFGICSADEGGGTDTWWPITGYIFNNSGSADVNETRLNATIEALDSDTIVTSLPYSNLTGSIYITQINISGGITLPSANVTGLSYTTALPMSNITGRDYSILIYQANISDGITIPSTNITGLSYTTTLPYTNITGTIYITQVNISGGITIPSTNVTGLTYTTTLPMANITNRDYSILVSQANISSGITIPATNVTGLSYTTELPATNITAGTFPAGDFEFQNNLTVDWLCLNAGCTSYIYNNGTHSIWK